MKDEKNRHLKNSRELIDCGLSDLGKYQCEVLSKTLQEVKIKYVFISPLNRAIDTCYLSLKDHSQFKDIKFIILPLASEIVDSSCDIPVSSIEKKEKYKDFHLDWSHLKDHYFHDNIDDANFVEMLKTANLDKYEENYHIYEKGLELCKSNDVPAESVHHLFHRGKELKAFLKKFVEENPPVDDEKILVFTHSALSKIQTSSLAHTLEHIRDFPDDCYTMMNCEFMTISF